MLFHSGVVLYACLPYEEEQGRPAGGRKNPRADALCRFAIIVTATIPEKR